MIWQLDEYIGGTVYRFFPGNFCNFTFDNFMAFLQRNSEICCSATGSLFKHANPVTQSTLNKSLFHLTRVAYLKVESLTKTALASVLDTEVVQLWFAV